MNNTTETVEELAMRVASLQGKAILAQAEVAQAKRELAQARRELRETLQLRQVADAIAFYERFGHLKDELEDQCEFNAWFDETFREYK